MEPKFSWKGMAKEAAVWAAIGATAYGIAWFIVLAVRGGGGGGGIRRRPATRTELEQLAAALQAELDQLPKKQPTARA